MIYRNQISPETILMQGHLALVGTLRQLWLQLAIWSRSLIVSTAGNLGDVQAIVDRMMKIPDSFAAALEQYFEPQVADGFRRLMTEHISALTALVSAEKSNDIPMVNQETVNLYNNADRMGSYLAGINNYWNKEQWTDLLDDYIEILLADLVARNAGEYEREIVIFDDLQSQAIKIADYMAQGIIERFGP